MIEPLLKSQLEPVARRHRRFQLWRGLAIAWAGAAAVGLLALLLQRALSGSFSLVIPLVLALAVLAAWIGLKRSRRWDPDYRQIARDIEQQHPKLHALLLTAVEQQPDPQTGQLNFLQERVVKEAVQECKQYQWLETVSTRQLFWMQTGHLAALALLVTVLLTLRSSPPVPAQTVSAVVNGVKVTPGDTEIEKGNGLVVLAHFEGRIPAEATLVVTTAAGKTKSISLVKNLNDPVFGGRVPEVADDLSYHVEYGGERTKDFKVRVFEHPRLERADAQITFPDYTGLPEKKIPDTRRVSAVEGSSLQLALQLNKPVRSATFVAKDKSVVPLTIQTNKASVSLEQFKLSATQSYDLQLVDAEGRTNKVPAQFFIDVLKNRAPELKLASPKGDQRVSPLQEISFQAEAWDDFGLRSYGLTYTMAESEPVSLVLGEAAAANEKKPFQHMLSLEALGAQPDQLISYFVWAEDIGPDGKVRRTASDMFFAEVRPFEEIYREGQPQEGQDDQKPPGNETTKLAELQKQIINATWKLQRQETRPDQKEPSAQYKKDAPVVQQSQGQALEQAQDLKERMSDPRFKPIIEKVEEQMETALGHLTKATNSAAPLPSALAAEQAAYQSLLKLSAREYQVTQSKSKGQGQASGEQRNQQQLDQLEMKQAENRYETERQATPQQTAEQQEQLQVFNRLKELAQRQQDLNERIKELQNTLQEAKSEAEREEIRNRLKRLREEEQEMLADLDELGQKMDQPQNQSRMAEARQQLDKTRGQVQQAVEALEKEAVPQALTAGTRAQRELQELRDEFRKKNSSQFSEEMRQMRAEARELAQKQEDIGKKMDADADNKRKTLADSDKSKALADQLQKQNSTLTNLLENMRQVTDRAENVEPLLSKQLYETLRQNTQENAKNLKETTDELLQKGTLTRSLYNMLKNNEGAPNRSLEVTEEMLRRGNTPEARQLGERVERSMQDLKKGVEQAAESVLGDEAEALRLAKRELDDLAQQLNNEIARSDPSAKDPSQSQTPGQPSDQTSEKSAGQNPQGQGESKQGESKPGEQSSREAGEQAQSGSGEKPGDQEGQPAQASAKQSGEQKGEQGQKGQQGEKGQQGQQGQQGQGQQGQQGKQGQGQQGQPGQQAQPGQGNVARNAKPNAGPAQDAKPATQQPQRIFDQNQGEEQKDPQGRGTTGQHGPLTGSEYGNWSDRLRNVEEMVDLPDLRNEAAQIRERAKSVRVDFKRHGKEPQWDLVKSQIATPLAELRKRVSEELARRESPDNLVPIDRDPVPNKFSDLVRRYYEKLGSSE